MKSIDGKLEEPLVAIETAEDIVRQVVGDPHCLKSGCHGKGYTGIRANKDGTRTVMMCVCGRWKETDYVRVVREIGELRAEVRHQTATLQQWFGDTAVRLNTAFERTQRRTFFGWIEWFGKAVSEVGSQKSVRHSESASGGKTEKVTA